MILNMYDVCSLFLKTCCFQKHLLQSVRGQAWMFLLRGHFENVHGFSSASQGKFEYSFNRWQDHKS